MPAVNTATPVPEQTAPTIRPGVPLPGTPVRGWEPFPWYDGPAFLVVDDATFHVRYRQTITGDGYPVRQYVGHWPETTGKDVRNWLRGSLRFWGCSQAAVTDDGTLYYRQTERHAALRFDPDPASGVLITVPDRQLTADAYRFTGPGQSPQLWTPATLRAAVTHATAPGVIDWPDGWAHLMPDGSVRFARQGYPWSAAPEYTAEPTEAPADWGPQCAECGRHASEHDPERGVWGTPCDGFHN
ncbi:hypothetical protein ACIP98_29245 [Streptomyces sp. NPDC088354]|uniref:hypothetical protein n=1 Tax=Streptomyces sp. NPDC088354 TaxID=3365856 RepID=UPI0038042C42